MSTTQNEHDAFAVIIGETDPISVALKERKAYNIADVTAREYLGIPGPKSVLDLMANIGNALTNSKEDFPAEMREVVLQQTVNNYKSKI